ncbi:putative transcriptional regulator [Opitutaceae bacterium TAV1]|nr:transcriptional regulator [Opitutaceae bacterium TAV5]EIP99850.1 putative transcriptional regulator [Opitutaceae bacterium TAV1]
MPPGKPKNDPLNALLVRLGENVRRARWNRNLTQEKLAELVDLHPRVLQKIEAGQTNILVTTAMRLQAALACPWEELMPPITPRFTKPK